MTHKLFKSDIQYSQIVIRMRARSLSASVLLAVLFLLAAAPVAAAAQPTSNTFYVPQIYLNFFYWFGDNGFGTNVAYGAWSNCPVYGGSTSYLANNPQCLVETANGNDAFQNSGWDSNIACSSSPSSSPCQEFILKGNTLTGVDLACFVNDKGAQIGCISMVFHGERRQGGVTMWIANPENPSNSLSLTDSSGSVIGEILMGGTLIFNGMPGATTFVSGSLQEWSYRTTAFYSSHSSQLPDAFYVPQQQAYLILTGIWDMSATPLTLTQMNSLVTSTMYLPPAPLGQSGSE